LKPASNPETVVVTDIDPFALVILLTSVVGLVAVLSNRLTEWVKVPTPALVLVGSAVAVAAVPNIHPLPEKVVERIVTVALICVLFEGGMHIGWSRFRSAAAPIITTGVVGTFATAAGAALVCHVAFGFSWYVSLLVGTAIAPTDPAVVFSVLGHREVSGPAGTILEGESGANDPVGIALMASLLTAGGLSWAAFAQTAWDFALQMVIGAAVGAVGGRALLWFMRRVPLPAEGLYPLRTLASTMIMFSLAVLAHGSGFLAVFVAGLTLGDERAPYKREIERFHSALASLGELTAFVVLGLTVNLSEMSRRDVWLPGLILAAILALVIRPVAVGVCLAPARLARNERSFVLFAGLKGAVPILLGGYLLTADVPAAKRLYGVVVVVAVFSVMLQGGLVPAVAGLLHLQMRLIEPEPWALGVRLRSEPEGVLRLTIQPSSPADGHTISDIGELPGGARITLLVREGRLLPVRGDTKLAAGDDITFVADTTDSEALAAVFEKRAAT
jgi:cell volume regulation protein A